jgi:hypothetical protein
MTADSLHRFLKSVSCRQVHEPSQSIFDEAGSQTLRKSILRQQNEFITITKNIKNAADVGCGDNVVVQRAIEVYDVGILQCQSVF